ncbi:hypothetical protein VNI00_015225 [Paramarasmius palmivorus]|uniref:F-box domain-containing protein n=1 Tax=Paramarasmius palmivorus TaxID=297713 RepID=A0AAW0BLK5_9AGAR
MDRASEARAPIYNDFLHFPHTILTPIFDNMSVSQLRKMRRVSTTAMQEIRAYDKITFSEKQLYKQFFSADDIDRFRAVQSKTRALATGDAITFHLARTPVQATLLKVLVPTDGLLDMGKFILSANFNFVQASYYVGNTYTTDISSSFNESFRKDCTTRIVTLEEGNEDRPSGGIYTFQNSIGVTVELTRTLNEPIDAVLAQRSTLDMNFATHNEIVSLYPRSSFIEKKAFYMNERDTLSGTTDDQYIIQGWTFATMISAVTALDTDHELSFKTRYVGDRHCWIVRFEQPVQSDTPGTTSETSMFNDLLFLSSWHTYCPTPSSTQLIRNQASCGFPPHSLVITWEAEKALWAYDCINMVNDIYSARVCQNEDVECLDLLNSFGEAQKDDRRVNNRHQHYQYLIKRVMVHRIYLHGDFPAEASDWGPSQEDELNQMTTYEQALHTTTRFLTKLYPILESNFVESSAFTQMRQDFQASVELYSVFGATIQCPTGHTVSTLIKCIEDMNHTRFCSGAKFSLYFDLEWEEDRLWTRCHFHVPLHILASVKEDLKCWSEEEFTNAYLKVVILQTDEETRPL